MSTVNISKLNKAEVLAALYSASRPLGMGHLQNHTAAMSVDDAQELLDGGQTYFDYVNGRVMKVDLSGDELRTALFNRDNGADAAESAIKNI